MPTSGGSMSMPAISMILGTEPRVAMPISAQAVQSMAMPRVCGRLLRRLLGELAEQVVGGAVIGLSAVAEPAGDRAEDDGGADGQVAGGAQQAEEAVRFDVEDQVELRRRFLVQRLADFHAAGMDQDVQAAVRRAISSTTPATAGPSSRSTLR